jgi:hypothetical protein
LTLLHPPPTLTLPLKGEGGEGVNDLDKFINERVSPG